MKQVTYGVDVAIRRTDDLDKRMISWVKEIVKENHVPVVLDLGCGAGGQSVRMSQAGAMVTGMDVDNYAGAFKALREENELTQGSLCFLRGTIVQMVDLLHGKIFDICAMQRAIHYVPYMEALQVLVYLKRTVRQKLYISVTGIESDIGIRYAHADLPIEKRFCPLVDEDAQTFCITQPVCLYTPEEFITLLQDAGWMIEEFWISAFGNIKAICK